MKKIILGIVIGLLFVAGITYAQIGGGISTPNFWMFDGTHILPLDATWELGATGTRIIKGWFTDLDTTNISIGGVSSGDIDMDNNLILNIGTSTTDFTAGGGLNLAIPLDVFSGGTGFSSFSIGDLLFATSTTALDKLVAGTQGYYLKQGTTTPEWSAIDLTSYPTGSSAANNLTYWSGTNTLTGLASSTAGYVLTSTTTAPFFEWAAMDLSVKANTALDNLSSVAINSSLIPATDSAIDLGSATPKYFANAYLDKIYLNSNLTVGAGANYVDITNVATPAQYFRISVAGTEALLQCGGTTLKIGEDVVPSTDSVRDLGSSALYWAETYTDKLYLNSTATLNGATAGKVDITGNVDISGALNTHTIPGGTGTFALGTSTANYLSYWSDANTLTGLATGTAGYVLTATGTSPYIEWAEVSAGVSGSGTANQMTYWDGSSSISSSANFLYGGSGQMTFYGGGSDVKLAYISTVADGYSSPALYLLSSTSATVAASGSKIQSLNAPAGGGWGRHNLTFYQHQNADGTSWYPAMTLYYDGRLLITGGDDDYGLEVAKKSKLDGNVEMAGLLSVLQTASSTIALGDADQTGCIVMGDSDGGGVSYITVLDGVLSATSTKPDICQ